MPNFIKRIIEDYILLPTVSKFLIKKEISPETYAKYLVDTMESRGYVNIIRQPQKPETIVISSGGRRFLVDIKK